MSTKKFRIIFSKTVKVQTESPETVAAALKHAVETQYKGVTVKRIDTMTDVGWKEVPLNAGTPLSPLEKEFRSLTESLSQQGHEDTRKLLEGCCCIAKSSEKRLVIGVLLPESYPQVATEAVKSQLETISHKKIQFAFLKNP